MVLDVLIILALVVLLVAASANGFLAVLALLTVAGVMLAARAGETS